jgi:hypothetical protein
LIYLINFVQGINKQLNNDLEYSLEFKKQIILNSYVEVFGDMIEVGGLQQFTCCRQRVAIPVNVV